MRSHPAVRRHYEGTRLCFSSGVSTALAGLTTAVEVAAAPGAVGVGGASGFGGHVTAPLCVTRLMRMTSSCRSSASTFSLLPLVCSRVVSSLVTLLAYRVEDCAMRQKGRVAEMVIILVGKGYKRIWQA